MASADLKTNTRRKLSSDNIDSYFYTVRRVMDDYIRALNQWDWYRSCPSGINSGYFVDDRSTLIDLYESQKRDGHLLSVIETLKSQVLGERYMMARQTQSGEFIRDLPNTKKIQCSAFVRIIEGILDAKLYGYTLLEILPEFDDVTGKLTGVNQIERRNVSPTQNFVARVQGQFSEGWNITNARYRDNYVLIDSMDLGLFASTTPIILAKKHTFANYIEFAGTYGQPIIQGKAADGSVTAKQQLASDIANSAAQRIIVTGLEDELDVHALSSSNSEQIFIRLMDFVNGEVSNLILGSESMAGATQSYVGSTNAHQNILRGRIEVYREFIQNIVNEEILPRLVKMGYLDDGLEFVYANNVEMADGDRISLINHLTDKYEISPDEIEREFGVSVGRQLNTSAPQPDGEPEINNESTVVNFLREV